MGFPEYHLEFSRLVERSILAVKEVTLVSECHRQQWSSDDV